MIFLMLPLPLENGYIFRTLIIMLIFFRRCCWGRLFPGHSNGGGMKQALLYPFLTSYCIILFIGIHHDVAITISSICIVFMYLMHNVYILLQFNLHLTGDIHAITAANNLLGTKDKNFIMFLTYFVYLLNFSGSHLFSFSMSFSNVAANLQMSECLFLACLLFSILGYHKF